VFDPRGGYYKPGGIYMPSIVAELGSVVEQHLKMIGLLHDPELDPEQYRLIAEKRAEYEARAAGKSAKKKSELSASPMPREPGAGIGDASACVEFAEPAANAFPSGATLCNKCNTQAVILMDGCATCLNCGYSKCG
jgi:hypothetical protein